MDTKITDCYQRIKIHI